MLVNCNSCQKKFIVPDSAISIAGRLVQCGSCGNKWTQYPVEKIKVIKTNYKKEALTNEIKTTTKKTKAKTKKNLYTAEYLQKKHGIVIDKPDVEQNKKFLNKKNQISSFGFYSYVVILFVFFITLFGILELSKEIITQKFSFTEIYINYFYEVVEITKIFLTQFID